jgi:hypothetical protein
MSLEKQSQLKERVFVHQQGSEHRIRRVNANIFKKAPRGENASANAFLVAPKMEGETSKLRVCFLRTMQVYACGKSGYCRVAVATLDGSRQKKTRTGT